MHHAERLEPTQWVRLQPLPQNHSSGETHSLPFALEPGADTDRSTTKETQVSANHRHIRSNSFQVPALPRDKSPLVLRLACMQGGYLGVGSRAPPRPLSIPVHGRCVPPSPCLVSISVWDLHQHLGQQAHPARMLPNQHPGPAQPRQGGTNLGSVFLLPEMSEGCRGREVTAP